MIFLVNALSRLEMRKALAHVKSHLLSMESIISAYVYIYIYIQCSFKVFLLWNKLPLNCRIQSILTDKKNQVISWYCKVWVRIPRDLQTLYMYCIIQLLYCFSTHCTRQLCFSIPQVQIWSWHLIPFSLLNKTTKVWGAQGVQSQQWLQERISGAGFLLLSGMGTGSFGRRLSFLVIMGFTSIESAE